MPSRTSASPSGCARSRVALRDAGGTPIAAIGLAAIRQRVSAERIPELVHLLERERVSIEQALVDGHGAA